MPIRPANARDLELLPAIERSAAQAFRKYPALAWLADSQVMDATAHAGFVASAVSWVAVDGQDRPLGFICVSVQGDALHVHELSVCSEAQGQGLGRQLLEHVLAFAEGRGLNSVTLTTFAEVPWNAPFYARLGFEVLSSEALDERLRQILAEERAHGLEGRCAMRRVVDAGLVMGGLQLDAIPVGAGLPAITGAASASFCLYRPLRLQAGSYRCSAGMKLMRPLWVRL